MIYYKVLNLDGSCCNGGTGQWNLPIGDQPGHWMPDIPDPLPCIRGYHLCRPSDLVQWIGPAIWTAEADGEILPAGNKVVAGRARLLRRVEIWTTRTAGLFAADCAEHVLPIFEQQYPTNTRPRMAVQATRDFAEGRISVQELNTATHAAWIASGNYDTPGNAASAASRQTPWATARDAAWAADDENAERAWQTMRLFDYLEGRVG